MKADDVVTAARAFVLRTYLYAEPDAVIAPDDSLIDQKILDSLGVMELVEWISSTYGIEVEDDELVEENLGTLAGIARFVLSKRGLAALPAA
jgi:acyl carrier protein